MKLIDRNFSSFVKRVKLRERSKVAKRFFEDLDRGDR